MYTESQMATYANGAACDRVEKELMEKDQRIAALECALRDCLESLVWYAMKARLHPDGATPKSVIGQARALLQQQ